MSSKQNIGESHVSTWSNFVDGVPITDPKKKMGANEPCWCASGKKYKKCHKNRHSQKRVNPHELEREAFRLFRKEVCSHPDASQEQCDKIIKFHTISKSAALRTIAENGHVYSGKARLGNLARTGKLVPGKIGINQASTFFGFCAKHDNATFDSIDRGDIAFDAQNIFLLSYRAVAYEAHHKAAELHLKKTMKEHGDKGANFEEQAAFQNFIFGDIYYTEMGLREVNDMKEKYDQCLMSGNYDGLKWLAVRIDTRLPVASAGGRFPDYDFEKNPLYDLSLPCEEYPGVMCNILNDAEGSIASMAWFADNSRSVRFAESFLKKIEEHGPDFIVYFGICTFDNTYIQPSWWENLSDDQKQKLCNAALSDADETLPEWFEVIAEPMKLGISGRVVEFCKNF